MDTLKAVEMNYVTELKALIAADGKTGHERAGLLSELLEHSPMDAFKASVGILVGKGNPPEELVVQACYTIGDCVQFGYAVSTKDMGAGKAALRNAASRDLCGKSQLATEQLVRFGASSGIKAIIPQSPVPARKLAVIKQGLAQSKPG